jgi:hypothetical protein
MGIGGYLLGKLLSPRQMGLCPNQGPVDLAGPTWPAQSLGQTESYNTLKAIFETHGINTLSHEE